MLFKTVHHHRLVLHVFILCVINSVVSRSSQLGLSDLKSKISGVEELLEEFRKQLQQDQAYSREDDAGDVCLSDFTEMEEHIIRARDSIEQGATFLSVPSRVYSWKDCLHACCLDPHCTVAVMQEDLKQTDESLGCYLFNCTYRNKNVCTFSLQQGFSTYSRVHNMTAHRPPAAPNNSGMSKQMSSRRRPLDNQAEDETSEQGNLATSYGRQQVSLDSLWSTKLLKKLLINTLLKNGIENEPTFVRCEDTKYPEM